MAARFLFGRQFPFTELENAARGDCVLVGPALVAVREGYAVRSLTRGPHLNESQLYSPSDPRMAASSPSWSIGLSKTGTDLLTATSLPAAALITMTGMSLKSFLS